MHNLFRKLFKYIENVSINEIDVIMQRVSSKCANDDEEIYREFCLVWFRRTPRNVRQVEEIINCLKEMELNGLVNAITVIRPGALSRACKEILPVLDRSDERNVVKKIAIFLKSLNDFDCKNLAVDLLLKL